MFKIVPFSDDLNLENFYKTALEKGYKNNSSRFWLKDCFRNERESETWILYYNDEPVGSVSAHTFDNIEKNSYRICARTCVFTDKIPTPSLRTRNQIITHQHVTAQFLIPTCIEWAPRDANLYITSNELETGTQRHVHNIFAPLMEKQGIMKRVKDIEYRGTTQTVWSFDSNEFYKQLYSYTRWQ